MYYPIVHGTLSDSIVFSTFPLCPARRWLDLRLQTNAQPAPATGLFTGFGYGPNEQKWTSSGHAGSPF